MSTGIVLKAFINIKTYLCVCLYESILKERNFEKYFSNQCPFFLSKNEKRYLNSSTCFLSFYTVERLITIIDSFSLKENFLIPFTTNSFSCSSVLIPLSLRKTNPALHADKDPNFICRISNSVMTLRSLFTNVTEPHFLFMNGVRRMSCS